MSGRVPAAPISRRHSTALQLIAFGIAMLIAPSSSHAGNETALTTLTQWLQDPAMLWVWKALLFLGILLVAWVGAAIGRSVISGVLRRIELDRRLGRILDLSIADQSKRAPSHIFSQLVFWLILLLGLVAALNYADLTLVAEPLEGFVSTIIQALPSVLWAVGILALAYVAGVILRKLVVGVLRKSGLDQRLTAMSSADGTAKPFSHNLGALVFWGVLFIGLVGAFDALNLKTIASPLSNMLNKALSLLPALATAALILFAGYILGRIVHTIVKNVLHSIGFDGLPARLKLEKLFSKRSASDLVGLVAMVFIVVHATIAALAQLSLYSVSEPLTEMVERFWTLLPRILLAAVILSVGVFLGRMIGDLVKGLLGGIGFDDFLAKLGLTFGSLSEPEGEGEERMVDRPSALAGVVVQIAIILIALVQVLDTLSLFVWANMVTEFLSYTFLNALVAMVIVLGGLAAGNYLRNVIQARSSQGDPGTQWIASAVRIGVLIFAFTMALQQLKVAPTFVLLTFGLIFGALCLTLALAFGLGAREIAGKVVKKQYEKAQTAPTRSSDHDPSHSA